MFLIAHKVLHTVEHAVITQSDDFSSTANYTTPLYLKLRIQECYKSTRYYPTIFSAMADIVYECKTKYRISAMYHSNATLYDNIFIA